MEKRAQFLVMKLSLKVIPQTLFDGASQVVLVVKYLPANAGD